MDRLRVLSPLTSYTCQATECQAGAATQATYHAIDRTGLCWAWCDTHVPATDEALAAAGAAWLEAQQAVRAAQAAERAAGRRARAGEPARSRRGAGGRTCGARRLGGEGRAGWSRAGR